MNPERCHTYHIAAFGNKSRKMPRCGLRKRIPKDRNGRINENSTMAVKIMADNVLGHPA